MTKKLKSVQRTISQNLRSIRLNLGLTAKEVAKGAGVSERMISMLENDPDSTNITVTNLEGLAIALDVSMGDLLSSSPGLKNKAQMKKDLNEIIQRLKSFKNHL